MTKVLFAFLLTCVALFWACQKNNKSNPDSPDSKGHSPPACVPHTTYMTNALLLSCKYKAGSYWVFRDSISGSIDTLVAESLNRSGYLKYGLGCDTTELFVLTLRFKRETISAFKTLNYFLFPDSILFQNNFLWTAGDQNGKYSLYNRFSVNRGGCTMHDSLLLNNVYYKNVGESFAIQFVKDDPNRMESQSMKTFFNPEFGPLQLDFRDRLTGQLTVRRQILARNIVR